MAKSKKSNKGKPTVKVHDLEPEKDPKGGALYIKYDSPTLKSSNSSLKIEGLTSNSFLKFNK